MSQHHFSRFVSVVLRLKAGAQSPPTLRKKSENGEAAGTTHRLCDWVLNLVSIQPINKRNGDHDFLTSVFPRLASARSTFSCSDPCVCCDWLNKRVRFCKTLVTRKLLKKFTGNARAENDDGKYSR